MSSIFQLDTCNAENDQTIPSPQTTCDGTCESNLILQQELDALTKVPCFLSYLGNIFLSFLPWGVCFRILWK